VRTPDASGVAGLSPTPRTVFQSLSATSDQIGKVRHNQNGIYIAAVYYRWWNGSSWDHREEENLPVGQSRVYDPGLKGVPAGALFEVRASVSAGPDLHVIPDRQFRYTPGSTATAIYQTSDILTSADFDFLGIRSSRILGLLSERRPFRPR
jgi:hypothetical protein